MSTLTPYCIAKLVTLLVGVMMMHGVHARDPMAPPGYSSQASQSNAVNRSAYIEQTTQPDTPRYVVEQVIMAGNKSRAVINGEVVNEGDRIGAAWVISISKQAVVLRANGEQLILAVQDSYPTVRYPTSGANKAAE